MILGYFLFGALVGGVIGYVCAAILSLDNTDDEDEENKDEQSN